MALNFFSVKTENWKYESKWNFKCSLELHLSFGANNQIFISFFKGCRKLLRFAYQKTPFAFSLLQFNSELFSSDFYFYISPEKKSEATSSNHLFDDVFNFICLQIRPIYDFISCNEISAPSIQLASTSLSIFFLSFSLLRSAWWWMLCDDFGKRIQNAFKENL